MELVIALFSAFGMITLALCVCITLMHAYDSVRNFRTYRDDRRNFEDRVTRIERVDV